MSKPKVHLSKVREHRGHTRTGALCDRFTVGVDGMNVTTVESEVTCKCCLKALNRQRFSEAGSRNAEAANKAEENNS
jgi:hypothetical protein